MTAARMRALLIGALFALVAAPVTFLAGVYVFGALMLWKGGAGGGEAVQAAAFGGLIFGGPVGLLVGSLLVGGIAAWNAHRLSWPVAIALLIALAGVSGFAMGELGVTGT